MFKASSVSGLSTVIVAIIGLAGAFYVLATASAQPATPQFETDDIGYSEGDVATITVTGLDTCTGEEVEVGLYTGSDLLNPFGWPVTETVDDSGSVEAEIFVSFGGFFDVRPGVVGDCLPDTHLGGIAADFTVSVRHTDPLEAGVIADRLDYVTGDTARIRVQFASDCIAEPVRVGFFTAMGDEIFVQTATVEPFMPLEVEVPIGATEATAYVGIAADCIQGGYLLNENPIDLLGNEPTETPTEIPGEDTFTYDLYFRWTLIAWVGEDGTPIEEALVDAGAEDDISDDVTVIWHWDASQQHYLGYFPNAPAGTNDLTVFEKHESYWVAIGEDTEAGDLPDIRWTIHMDDDDLPPDGQPREYEPNPEYEPLQLNEEVVAVPVIDEADVLGVEMTYIPDGATVVWFPSSGLDFMDLGGPVIDENGHELWDVGLSYFNSRTWTDTQLAALAHGIAPE